MIMVTLIGEIKYNIDIGQCKIALKRVPYLTNRENNILKTVSPPIIANTLHSLITKKKN